MLDTVEVSTHPTVLGYQAACDYTLDFLKAHLDGDSSRLSERMTQGTVAIAESLAVTAELLPAEKAPPTAEQLQAMLEDGEIDSAVAVCERFGLPTAATPVLSEVVYNALGYRFLQRGSFPPQHSPARSMKN